MESFIETIEGLAEKNDVLHADPGKALSGEPTHSVRFLHVGLQSCRSRPCSRSILHRPTTRSGSGLKSNICRCTGLPDDTGRQRRARGQGSNRHSPHEKRSPNQKRVLQPERIDGSTKRCLARFVFTTDFSPAGHGGTPRIPTQARFLPPMHEIKSIDASRARGRPIRGLVLARS